MRTRTEVDRGKSKILIKSSYRPEIDGLRAVAVALVIGHHFSSEIVPSGYVGVDLFFVISGFVITASLMNRPGAGLAEFLVGFYGRRMRRLLPALTVCILATSSVVLFLNPRPYQSLMTGLSALFGLSNVFLWAQKIDYFSPSTNLNAFTHTWSLGVEEQFYMLFPVLFFLLYFRVKSKSSLVLCLAALTFSSWLFFLLKDRAHPETSYYLLPGRFWEIGAGALVCLLSRPHWLSRARWIDGLLWIAFGALLVCAFLPLSLHLTAATVTVVVATLLIAAGQNGATFSRVFSWSPLVYLGLISYPLYLWHWPVLSLSRWTVGISPSTAPLQLLTMSGLAWATYRYVELPARYGKFLSKPSYSLVSGTAAIICSGILVAGMINFQDASTFISADLPPAWFPLRGSSLPHNPTCVVDGLERRLTPATVDNCTVAPAIEGSPTFWLMGDSHAGHLQGMLYALNDRLGVGVHLIETPGVTFPFGTAQPFQPRLDIFRIVEGRFQKGDVLLLARLYTDRSAKHLPQDGLLEWAQEVVALANSLKDRGVSVVVIGPPPIFNFDVAEACLGRFWKSDCSVDYETVSSEAAAALAIVRPILAASDVPLFEPFPILCPPARRCSPMLQDTIGFRDHDHLNVVGAAALAEPFTAFALSHNLIGPDLIARHRQSELK